MRWKGNYSDTYRVAWEVVDGDRYVAYAVRQPDGKWRVRIGDTSKPFLILDNDPKVFMPHLLMTLAAAQRND